MSRRAFLQASALGVCPRAWCENGFSTAAIDLVRSSTVIDMLGLLTLDYRKLCTWQCTPDAFRAIDLERLKDSGINVFHPAVGFTRGDIYRQSLDDIDRWNQFLAAHPADFLRVDTPADIDRAKSSGKLGIVLGLQNSSHFRNVDDVDAFYRLGQRVSQLTYAPNRIGGGSTDPHDPGLTEFGASVVERMNRVGMAIDVSHCADRTTLDAIAASKKPVLVTHSNCRALVPSSPRCKTDEAIKALAARGGVMGVTMIRFFVSTGATANLENVLDHIDHVAAIAGVEHAGIGSDEDLAGHDHGPRLSKPADLDGFDYARKMYAIAEGLLRRGYSKPNIALILGGNFRRVLAEIWSPAALS
ncbi:MAG TPA: membrane dipeptidase [Bryobacteraceae bacterium]|nr:membrane dipeptidase [Bryobacteraceae bacterium]